MIPFKHVNHVSLVVSDVDKAKAFWGGVVGLREAARPEFEFPGAWYSLGGNVQLHIIANEGWPFPPRSGFEIRAPHFALWVEDADALAARLERDGVHVDDYVSTPTGLRQLFLHDPDGNMVEFIGPTARTGSPAR